MTMMGFTEHVLFCFLLHVPLFLIEPNPLQSCSDLKYCLSATVSPIRSSGPCILVLSVLTQCVGCGFQDGCSLLQSLGD